MSGAACFGLETHFGPQMLTDLLKDTTPVAAIAADRHLPKLAAALAAAAEAADDRPMGAAAAAPLLQMDAASDWRATVAAAAAAAPPREAWARAAPYDAGIITMTSGTSGKPKAIACPAIAYAVAVRARQARLPYAPSASDDDDEGDEETEEESDAAEAPPPTDEVEAANVMFVWEAMRPLCYGATSLVVPDEVVLDTTRLPGFLQTHKATRVLTTPSLFATMLETAAEVRAGAVAGATDLATTLVSLSLWLLCGEVVPASLGRRAAEAVPHLTLCNDYSSWEGSDVSIAEVRGSPRSKQ